MTLDEAIERKKYLHLLGKKQENGAVFTDIIIAPVSNIEAYCRSYIETFNEQLSLSLYPSVEYGIIAIDRNLLMGRLFAYEILEDAH